MANGKMDEIKVWIQRAARWNKKDPEKILSRFISSSPDNEKQTTDCSNSSDEAKYNILDIFRRKRILIISLILWLAW
jgi:hypothetical protein